MFKTEGIVADGTFENGSFTSGILTVTSQNRVTQYTGTFEVRKN